MEKWGSTSYRLVSGITADNPKPTQVQRTYLFPAPGRPVADVAHLVEGRRKWPPAADMVEFWTLGTFDLRTPDGRKCARLLARPKCLAILAYLAVSGRSRLVPRDTLLALFWPETDESHARLALRQVIHILRRALGPKVVVTTGSSMVGLAPNSLWCDAVAFEAALDAGQDLMALELYGGDFLPGLFLTGASEFDRWVWRERSRLRSKASAAAWTVAEEMESMEARTHAAFWARRAVELAPYDEQGVRRLLTLLERVGDCGGALRAYDEFSRLLAAEFEITPSPETDSLVHAIRIRAQSVGTLALLWAGITELVGPVPSWLALI
jgi:DNA-binding SARP family transcriptional activator